MSTSLKQRVYSHLFQKLCSGELRPGDRLSGRSIAKEIGVSPIPVRDAIGQLHCEGFFEVRQGGGTYVPEPRYEDLMDIYDQREALECHAVARTAEAPDAETLNLLQASVDSLVDLLKKLSSQLQPAKRSKLLEEWACVDAVFHDTLMSAAGNKRSMESVTNLRIRSRIYGLQIFHESLDSLRRTYESHRRILDRICSQDVEGARQAMAEHIRAGCQQAIGAHYRKQGTQQASARATG